ncbi:hypothetical protein [Sporosarcina trichiuri]|uniref:hypothetical protein n=1 Tax=Sporosarcina trichiuri TaxID=3056445 RepID=UPI0025B5215A|nr:hypothetical protein [Sporosarcina sp. 0.2-SM1T-5]WJY27279.1 hypothetical protein QWT68_14755 [Sporosarcina sp. 0.2-SM1T-5]
MKLLACIAAAVLLGILAAADPVGAYVAGVIVLAILFRTCLYIRDLHTELVPKRILKADKVQAAYDRYLQEREQGNQEARPRN